MRFRVPFSRKEFTLSSGLKRKLQVRRKISINLRAVNKGISVFFIMSDFPSFRIFTFSFRFFSFFLSLYRFYIGHFMGAFLPPSSMPLNWFRFPEIENGASRHKRATFHPQNKDLDLIIWLLSTQSRHILHSLPLCPWSQNFDLKIRPKSSFSLSLSFAGHFPFDTPLIIGGVY